MDLGESEEATFLARRVRMDEIIKHLELIQSVINRMAQVSFVLKGWTVTIVVTLLAIAATANVWWYGLLALFPACIFWGLDAYYLRQERLFRCLYDKVRLGPTESGVDAFSMDTNQCQATVDGWFQTLGASTISALHGTVVAAVIIVIVLMHFFA